MMMMMITYIRIKYCTNVQYLQITNKCPKLSVENSTDEGNSLWTLSLGLQLPGVTPTSPFSRDWCLASSTHDLLDRLWVAAAKGIINVRYGARVMRMMMMCVCIKEL